MRESGNKEPLVSVIVPIYNVVDFINRGIEFLFKQDFTDFEVLLIDDGSTDGSGRICDFWAEKKENIRVFHKENEGAGSARNVGILNAYGKYLYFFDIDDEPDPELLSYNVRIMEEKEVDYILFGFRVITPSLNNLCDEIRFDEKEICSNEDLRAVYVDTFVLSRHGNGFPWNKFYRRSFLLKYNLFFENQRIQQDEVFNLNLYFYLQKAYISPKILYTYYIYDKGNTRVRFIPDRFDIYLSVYDHFKSLKTYWQLIDPRFDDYLYHRFYYSVKQCLSFNMFHQDCTWTLEEKKKELYRIISNPITKEVFCYMKDHERFSLEGLLYQSVYISGNLELLRVYISVLSLLRRIKNVIC